MAELVGPQTLPELSLSVPRLGPGGGSGGFTGASSISAALSRPPAPANSISAPSPPQQSHSSSIKGQGASSAAQAAAPKELVTGAPRVLDEFFQRHFCASPPDAVPSTAHAATALQPSTSPPAAAVAAVGTSTASQQHPNPTCLDELEPEVQKALRASTRSGLSSGLRGGRDTSLTSSSAVVSAAAAATTGGAVGASSSFLTASALRAARLEDRERQVAQSVKDFPAMLRGGRSHSSLQRSNSASSAQRNRSGFAAQRSSLPHERKQHHNRSSSTGRVSVRRSSSLQGMSAGSGVSNLQGGGSLPSRSPDLRSSPPPLEIAQVGDLGSWALPGPHDSQPPWIPLGQAARNAPDRTSRSSSAEYAAAAAERRALVQAATAAMAVDPMFEGLSTSNGPFAAGAKSWLRHSSLSRTVPPASTTPWASLPPSITPRASAEWRKGNVPIGAPAGEWHRQTSRGTAESTAGTPSSSFRQERGNWPLLHEGFEPLGPMLRSLEFQVGALFELMDVHTSRDVADCGAVGEVIDRKRESLAETFEAVKEALWWQQRKQRQSRHRSSSSSRLVRDDSESPNRTLSSAGQLVQEHVAELSHDASSSSLGNVSTKGLVAAPVTSTLPISNQPATGAASGLLELEALQQQLARRMAVVVEDRVFSESSAISSLSTRALPKTAPLGAQPDVAASGSEGIVHQASPFTPAPSGGHATPFAGQGTTAVPGKAPIADVPGRSNGNWQNAQALAAGVQEPLANTTVPAQLTGLLPALMLAAPMPFLAAPQALPAGWPLTVDAAGLGPSDSLHEIPGLASKLSPELASFSATIPAQAPIQAARSLPLPEMVQPGLAGIPAMGLQAGVAQSSWPFANLIQLDMNMPVTAAAAYHASQAAALTSVGLQVNEMGHAADACSAGNAGVVAAAGNAGRAGFMQSAVTTRMPPGFAASLQEPTSPVRRVMTPSTAERSGVKEVFGAQVQPGEAGSVTAATACPVGESLQGTAMSPLVLTPTVFHYRSPD